MKKALLKIAFLCLLLFSLFHMSRSRTFQVAGEIIPRVETNERVVALTLDDGPSAEHTPGVLATLKRENVAASFYLTGSEIRQNTEAARMIVAAGHEIGNHSWSHKRMVFRLPGFMEREVESTDKEIRSIGWKGEIFFRPPYCKKLVSLPLYLALNDRKTITFDVEPETDPEIDGNTDRIVSDVLQRTKPGSIILLHVMYDGREASRAALTPIIRQLKKQGYRFVTVSELLRDQS